MTSNKRQFKILYFLVLVFLENACSVSNPFKAKPQELDFIVVGVQTAPEDAVGNAAPLYVDVIWESLTLTRSEGEDVVYEPDDVEAGTLRVVGREQIVLTKKMADYEGETFNGVSVVFNASGLMGGFYGEYETTWPTTFAFTTDSFTVAKGEDIRIILKVNWFNTIEKDFDAGTETLTLPSFSLEAASEDQ